MFDYVERRRELRQRSHLAEAEGRLPAGQALTEKWPVLHGSPVPEFDLADWRFSFSGLVGEPSSLTWDEFIDLPRVTKRSDIHCVTRWTKLDNVWEGPSARTVLQYAKAAADARFVLVHAPGYTANLPIGLLEDDSVLFALKHDGRELTPVHGYPVRLVVPQRYFWKSVKWVTGLEFLRDDEPGYWEQRGYHNDGDPFREERFGS